ncbi:MAG: hypothetical protein ACFFCW_01890 [Candidatus Hodarchaeota archaeon]
MKPLKLKTGFPRFFTLGTQGTVYCAHEEPGISAEALTIFRHEIPEVIKWLQTYYDTSLPDES